MPREIKDNLNKWSDISFLEPKDYIFLRCLFSLNWPTDSIQSKKNLNRFFSRNWQVDLKMYIEIHRIQHSQSNQYLISRLTIKATVIKMTWYGWKRERHQRSTTENPEIDTHIHGHWFSNRHQDNSMKKKKKEKPFHKLHWNNWI